MRSSSITERFRKALPEVRRRSRVVKQVASAKDGIHRIAPSDIEDRRNYGHPRARQLLLRFFGERRKSSSEVPVRSMQEPQHYVSVLGGAIRKVTWNSRVMVGAR